MVLTHRSSDPLSCVTAKNKARFIIINHLSTNYNIYIFEVNIFL